MKKTYLQSVLERIGFVYKFNFAIKQTNKGIIVLSCFRKYSQLILILFSFHCTLAFSKAYFKPEKHKGPESKDVFLAGQEHRGLSHPIPMTHMPGGEILFGKETVIADFEGETYGDWSVEGEAFGTGPAQGTLPGQKKVGGYIGKGLVNSYNGGDGTTGTLTSPDFTVKRKYITFLVGGGGWKGKTCMNLLVDDKVVRTTTGPNVKSGGSELLAPAFWDVSEFIGKTAKLQIVDNATGCWGHINVDHIVLKDTPPPQPTYNATRTITVDKHWIMLPVKNGAKKCKMQLKSGEQVLRFFDIELAPEKPDWFAPLDVSCWTGKKLTLWVDKLTSASKGLQHVTLAETPYPEDLYQETLRPQLHFSAARGWLNDPNGLCYYNGEYHLFFQHNPYGTKWGNMHWGHAVSKDLIHWEQLPEALYPDQLGPMFSGSAVVDHNNTSGFGKDGKAPLVLIYTAAGHPYTQCIAYSNDGRNFTKYDGNPVVKNITGGNRDPKVIWHEHSKHWVMALYVGRGERHTTAFLISKDLKTWVPASTLKGGSKKFSRLLYECPNLFPLPIDDTQNQLWVTFGASLDYLIGDFDGKTFTPQTTGLAGATSGSSIYAAQSYSDHPDGKRVLVGWLRADAPGMPFNQCMTIPQELGLKTTPCGVRLTHKPIKAVESLRNKRQQFSTDRLTPQDKFPLKGFPCREQEVLISAKLSFDAHLEIKINDIEIGYLAASECLTINGRKIKWSVNEGLFDIRIFTDRTSIEIFSEDGLQYGTYPHVQKTEELKTTVKMVEGEATDVKATVYSLNSCWK